MTCFLSDPDPQLCNVSLPTTLPTKDETTSAAIPSDSNNTEATKFNIAPTQLQTTSSSSVSFQQVAARHEETRSIPATHMMIVTGTLVFSLVAGVACFTVFLGVCLVLKRRRNKKSWSSQNKKSELQPKDNSAAYAETDDVHQTSIGKEIAYHYTINDAYDSRPPQVKITCYNEAQNGTPTDRMHYFDDVSDTANGLQQNGEPVYEVIPCNLNVTSD